MNEQPATFTLWFRERRGRPWEPYAVAATEQELTNIVADSKRGGEWITLKQGSHPDRQWRMRQSPNAKRSAIR